MASYFENFLIFAFVVFVLLYFIVKSYWNFKKKISSFPFYNILPYIIYCYISGKISKSTPLNNIVFEKLVEMGKRHMKEGFFMTYFSRPILFIFSEDAIKFFANEKVAVDKSPEYKMIEDAMKNGIGMSNGEKWKKHRKLINPAFHMGMLQKKVPLFNEHALNLIADMTNLVNEPSVDITGVLKFHYVNALYESVLGLEQNNEIKEQARRFLEKSVDDICAMTIRRITCPWLRPKFLLNMFPSGRKYLRQNKEAGDFIDRIILDMKDCVLSKNFQGNECFGNHLRKSFTYILLNQHLSDPTFTLEDLHGEVRNIIATGFDTITFSSVWCLFLLGLHPEVQEKVYNEVLTTTSSFVNYEETTNLTYLEAVIMETLRLFPIVPIYARNLSEDVQYGKHKVFKGTTIAFFAYLSHRNPDIFPDPDEFKPERFLNEETRKSHSFLPFAEGNRSCIGQNYALIEMKIFLSHVLRNFKITSLDQREDVKLCWAILLSPANPIRFKIEQR